MANVYQVTIQLSPETLQALQSAGFSLLVFMPVQATAAGGQPVVFLQTQSLAMNITVEWSASYAAYVSMSQIAINGTILMTSEAPVSLGDVAQVGQEGILTVTGGGAAGAISILNTTSTPYTCGMAMTAGANVSPTAAFPLYGNSMDAIVPLARAFFVFESYPAAQSGQILDRTLAQGVLVDFTTGLQRSVAFDINSGWSFGGASWGQLIPANTSLKELLVHQAPIQVAQHVEQVNASLQS